MKKLLLSILSICTLAANAQKDLQIQIVNPQNDFEINNERPFQVSFRVKNVGMDTILNTDTFNLAILLNFQVLGNPLRGAIRLAPGDSVLLSPPGGGLNITFNQEVDSALFCAAIFFADSTIDTNNSNDADCVLGSLRFFPTGNPEIKDLAQSIKAYPNPASSVFTINMKSSNATVLIYDITGKLIETAPVVMGEAGINVERYSNGVYLYQVQLENGTAVHSGKFTVRH
jgi:archaellum component FlaG (FlaF/FlaG flagellin family)